jgi:hypothetical protein
MKKTFLLLLIIFMQSCGYQPIYLSKNNLDLKFTEIQLEGDVRISNQIVKILSIKEEKSTLEQKKILIESLYNINETSKNSKGQVETYETIINVKITITENNKIKKTKEFNIDTTYNNKDNKFELSQLQTEIKNNLIIKISEEIILFLNVN